MLPDLRSIEYAFFEAMVNGYVQDAPKTTIAELPGSKVITFEWGDYKILDCYFVNPHSAASVGQTMIWHQGVPVWTMNYGGRYAKIALPFLKACLRRAYVTERRFYGGRGPRFVQDNRFTYVNNINRGSFKDFKGEEFIFDMSEQCFGHHWYNGMSLLKSD